MDYLTSPKFSFTVGSLPHDTFQVVSFKGSERISTPYKFEIMLESENLEIDFKSVVRKNGTLIFHGDEGDILRHGIVSNFDQLHEVDGHAFYRAYLAPRLWWLSIIQNNQVFLDTTISEFLESVLKEGGLLPGLDFEFHLMGSYDPVEYVCQYGETNLNFLSRWCEREGIYYYFEQKEDREKIIFTDTKIAHVDPPSGGAVIYSPPSALESLHTHEIVLSFHCHNNILPEKVLLKDYNYRKPSLEVTGEATVDENGKGTVYFYHEHFRTPEEGERLAKIRAESIICKGEEYFGESGVPSLLPGYTFLLTEHYRKGFNQKYLTIEVAHEGDQTGMFSGADDRPSYTNHFIAIPAMTQFRPPTLTKKPRVSGTILAKIDSGGSGQYAELDDMGRYKVVIPFDLSGRKNGKASSWIRMAQPYGGRDHGMHFPLHKDTEVLLTFVNGDPDRPIIAGVVPNPATPSPVTNENQTANVIHTAGGNKIHIEDRDGGQHIHLQSPVGNTHMRLGAGDAPGDSDNHEKTGKYGTNWAIEKPNQSGIEIATSSWIDVSAGARTQVTFENANTLILGVFDELVFGNVLDTVAGGREVFSAIKYWDISIGKKWEYVPPAKWTFVGLFKKQTAINSQTRNAYKNSFRDEMMKELVKVKGFTEWRTEANVAEERWVGREKAFVGEKTRSVQAGMATQKQVLQTVQGEHLNVRATLTMDRLEANEKITRKVTQVETSLQQKGVLARQADYETIEADLVTVLADVVFY